MEGDRRKRKLENEKEEEEEESEEQQMEKFFALIESTKEVRDRVSREKKEEKEKGVWNPTFQPEDFLNEQELARINKISHSPAAAASSGEEEKKGSSSEATEAQDDPNKQKAVVNLDLTLSL